MTTEAWLRRLTDEFWAAAGGPEPFPRDLEQPVLWALPLMVVKLPRLGLGSVREWLDQHRFADGAALRGSDRRLRGCLLARGDEAVVFLDGSDPPDERRLSLGHEIAHFLLDYRAPRARAERRLGPEALPVLDGDRPPSGRQRLTAVLLGVSLAPHVHLLARGPAGDVDRPFIYAAEREAHRLALELLAPADAVWERLVAPGTPDGGSRLVAALADLLAADFGLPPAVARRYARDLAGPAGQPTAREWLGLE